MDTKLSLRNILWESCLFLRQNYILSLSFFLLAYAAVYYAQALNISTNLPIVFAYLIYTYFFYYFFVCFYFKQKILLNKRRFANALIRMVAILLLAFATLLILKIGFKILFFLAGTLRAFPEVYEQLRDIYINILMSSYFTWFLSAFVFVILSFTFFIPAFAWISAVIGRDSSITRSFARTRQFLQP